MSPISVIDVRGTWVVALLEKSSFGILKRGGKVYTKVIGDTKTLMLIIKGEILLDRVVYSDCSRSYDTLDVSGFTTTGSSTQAIFPRKNRLTSMVLRTSGIKLKESCESTMESPKKRPLCS